MSTTVLVIDDDREYAEDLAALLSPEFTCLFARSGEAGLGMIDSQRPDAVVLDLMLEGGRNGLEVLASIRETDSALPVIMVTNHPSPETEAEALRRGALYYLSKSAGRAEVLAKLKTSQEIGTTSRERDRLRHEMSILYGTFLFSSPAMKALDADLDRIAAARHTTVLILGESGTGKSHLAREIHRRSARARQPFIRVNMAGLSEELARSELFGHTKGSFTGAVADRRGYFEAARGGTLFLDEIADLPLAVQGLLLQAVEEREIVPVGSSTARPVDTRIIAATNRDLEKAVTEGTFRQDLLSRFSVITIGIPPLREHPEDIPDLARYFLGKYSGEMHLPPIELSGETTDHLQHYDWHRGNIRELRNAIERALVYHGDDGVLGPEAFSLPADQPTMGYDYAQEKTRALRQFQQEFFERAHRAINSRIDAPRPADTRRLAELVGIPPQTVRRVLKNLGFGAPSSFSSESPS
ncbi:MAG: sigma-54-dependent Fis family transcriptional regulator [Candidatus Eisenbacteria sp.]|nr:sigma-54-dependent Fis family transcriptional regulator [Candidatus Eisenbacteria bacterium]